MTRTLSLLAIACVGAVVVPACSGSTSSTPDDWDSLDGYEDQFPAACEPLTKLVEYAYEHKGCVTDADCTFVLSNCLEAREHCSGAFYVNTQHDPGAIQSLFQAASTCPLEAPCCNGNPSDAKCAHGRCTAAPEGTELDVCLDRLDSDEACEFCACAASGWSHDCVYDPACIPIFQCAKAAGCYGTVACDLAAPEFPCKSAVDAAGGPKSAVAEAYRRANADAPRRGCDVACAGGD